MQPRHCRQRRPPGKQLSSRGKAQLRRAWPRGSPKLTRWKVAEPGLSHSEVGAKWAGGCSSRPLSRHTWVQAPAWSWGNLQQVTWQPPGLPRPPAKWSHHHLPCVLIRGAGWGSGGAQTALGSEPILCEGNFPYLWLVSPWCPKAIKKTLSSAWGQWFIAGAKLLDPKAIGQDPPVLERLGGPVFRKHFVHSLS